MSFKPSLKLPEGEMLMLGRNFLGFLGGCNIIIHLSQEISSQFMDHFCTQGSNFSQPLFFDRIASSAFLHEKKTVKRINKHLKILKHEMNPNKRHSFLLSQLSVLAWEPNTDTYYSDSVKAEFECMKYIVVTFPILSMLFTAKC